MSSFILPKIATFIKKLPHSGLVQNLHYYKSQPWSFTDTVISGFFCEVDGPTEIHMQEEELCFAQWISREDLPNRSGEISLTAEMIELFRTRPEHTILRFEPEQYI